MQDAWRAYVELALGLTEASRRRAEQVVRDLFDKGGATAAQAQSVVEDLMATSRSNREELTKLVRYEVERGLGVVGLATAEEVSQLARRVRELERQLRAAGGPATPEPVAAEAAAPPTAPATPTAAGPPVAKKVAKKAVKKPAAKKSAGAKTAAKKAT